jgi:uncharacterized damage-inducible protein DinB
MAAWDPYPFILMPQTVETPEGKMTGMELLLFAVDHTAHHRGQLIVYLRAKNIKPADYRF